MLPTTRNATTNGADDSADALLRNPITGTAPCCARAASGHAIAVADGEIAAGKAHDQVRCMPASSQMKNGVPMTAVRIPSGISTGAAVRARVSMKRR